PVMRAAQRLAINGNQLSVSQDSNRLHPGDEALLEFSGVQLGKDIAKGIVRWDSIRQFQKGAQPVSVRFTPLFHFSEVLGSTDRRQYGDSDDVDQFVTFVLIVSTRVRQLREVVKYRWCFCFVCFFGGHCGSSFSIHNLAPESIRCKVMIYDPL